MGGKLPFFPVYHHRGKLSISNFAEAQKTPLRRQKQRGQGKEDYWFFTESWGANKDLGEAPKSCTRKEHESATNSIARRGQGAMPLAGSRDSVPCGVWGNAPTVPRPTNPKEVANKGAGSEASLPVTLRVRRRALKLLFPQDSVKNRKNLRNTAEFRRKKDVYIEEVTSSVQSLAPSAAQPRRQQPPALRRG